MIHFINPIKNQNCVVITFLYKETYNKYEELAIKNLFNILGNTYDIIAVCPYFLNLSYYQQNFKFDNYIGLSDGYFLDFPKGYNTLLTNIDFYKIFSNYKYILIHHSDSWIFKNELEYWCNKNYDNIGAPFIYYFFYNTQNFKNYNPKNRVGNGGLCLRKISWCIDVLTNNKYEDFDQSKLHGGEYLNEDTFFVNQDGNFPSFYIAQKFAWSDHPAILFQVNDGQLPFGAHRFLNYLDIYRNLNLI